MSKSKSESTQHRSVSVVMSIWQGDQASQVTEAIESILRQTHKPYELIIVKDGAVGEAIEVSLEVYQDHPLISFYQLDNNMGRGFARNHAITNASGQIILIMDADDISRPKRIEKQLDVFMFEEIDILGCFIEEFHTIPGDLKEVRRVPLQQSKIEDLLRFRSAFNHVTLMFSKSFFEKINGYSNLNYVEDWDFYLRAIFAGGKVRNIPLILVDVRKAIWRRQSFKYLKEEIIVASRAFQRGQIPTHILLLNIFFRIGKFITPRILLNVFYKSFFRHKQD